MTNAELTDVERLVLKALGGLNKNHGMTLPDKPEWRQAALALAQKGIAERLWSFWYLTDKGRRAMIRAAQESK